MRVLIFALSLLLAACSTSFIKAHKIDVQQGNFVDQEMISKLKPGMTRSQVRFALGTPLVADPFHANRWDYVYRNQKGGGPVQQRTISVIFEEDKLARVEGDVVAAKSDRAALPERPAATKPAAAPAPPKKAAKAPPPAEPEPGLTEKLGRMIGLGSADDTPKEPVMLRREEPAAAPPEKVAAAEPQRRETSAQETAKPKPAAEPSTEKPAAPSARKPWEGGGKKPWEDGAKPWEGDGKLRNREGKTIGEQLSELFDFGGSQNPARQEYTSDGRPIPKDGKLRNREGKTIAEQIRDLFRSDDEPEKLEAKPAREPQPKATAAAEPAQPKDGKLRNREGKTIGEQIRDLFRSDDSASSASATPPPSPARPPEKAAAEPRPPVQSNAPAEASAPAEATAPAEASAPARSNTPPEASATVQSPASQSNTSAEASTSAPSSASTQSPAPKVSSTTKASAKEGKGFLRFFIEDILGFDEEWRRGEWQGHVK